jgi:beta-lactamase class A
MLGISGARERWWCICALLVVVAVLGIALTTTSGADNAQGTQMAPKTDVKPIGDSRATSAATSTTTPALADPTTAAPPSPTAPPATVDPALATGILAQPAVLAYLATRTGNVTAAVYDYATGQLSTYRSGLALQTASVIKLQILETLLNRVQTQGRGLTATEQRRAAAMMDASDNDSATDLWDEVGGAAGLNAFGAQVGLTGTAPNAAGYWGLSTTTATDQITLLRNLTDPSTALAPANQAYALGLMAQVEGSQTWGVSSGVAPGTTVALKDGWLPESDGWYVNSVGVLTGAGHHYAVAVLSTGGATQDYGEDTIETLSGLVWTAAGH